MRIIIAPAKKAENDITNQAELQGFDQLGYRFHEELSEENQYVFLTAPSHRARS